MLYATAYDTTVGSHLHLQHIKDALRTAVSSSDKPESLGVLPQDKLYPYFVTGRVPPDDVVPAFSHPMLLTSASRTYLCSDMRPYCKVDQDGLVSPKNTVEYNYTLSRLAITMTWIYGDETTRNRLRTDMLMAGSVWANWIGESMRNRFALDPRDTLRLKTLAAYYYQTLFLDRPVDDSDKYRFIQTASRITRVTPDETTEILKDVLDLAGIESFCTAIRSVVDNTRVVDMTPTVLLSILGNGWYGPNARETIAVALEHPPSWLSIIYICVTERSYKNNPIASIMDKTVDSRGRTDFEHIFKSKIAQYKAQEMLDAINEALTPVHDTTPPVIRGFE